MVLKRRFSYRWRIFIPLVILFWGILGLLIGYYYHTETRQRVEQLQKRLEMFNSNVLYALGQPDFNTPERMETFMKTLGLFFRDSNFSGVRVSVYEKGGVEQGYMPAYHIGTPIDRDFIDNMTTQDVDVDPNEKHSTVFFYKHSVDDADRIDHVTGEHRRWEVYTALERNEDINRTLNVADLTFWLVVALLTISSTVLLYIITGSIARNIKLLRDFASQANDDTTRFDDTKFPHNELGDISREIIRLYRERGEALSKSQREHEVAVHAVEDKARIKRQLTNNINHELKTPVGVIKGYLDTVLSTEDMDDKTRTYFLTRAQQNVDRLCNLLNDVSTMTRLEEGSGNIPISVVDFHDLVFSIENDFTSAGMTGNMTFEFDIPLGCEVLGNSGLLTSALSNLMKNSVIHSHGTAMGLKLVSESDNYYTFSFWDNGSGVDPVHIPHLFDRFFRVDSGRSRKSGGTGLGLPIVKNIIESLGGSLSVHNRSVGGLEFMFTLRKHC